MCPLILLFAELNRLLIIACCLIVLLYASCSSAYSENSFPLMVSVPLGLFAGRLPSNLSVEFEENQSHPAQSRETFIDCSWLSVAGSTMCLRHCFMQVTGSNLASKTLFCASLLQCSWDSMEWHSFSWYVQRLIHLLAFFFLPTLMITPALLHIKNSRYLLWSKQYSSYWAIILYSYHEGSCLCP